MDVNHVITLVKARLGISTSIRDSYLTAIVEGVVTELNEGQGLVLDASNPYHLMFVVDLATWRYQSVAESAQIPGRTPLSMPRHLQYRLHNLIVQQQAGGNDV